VIIPLDGYLEHFYQKDSAEVKTKDPVFIILVEPHQLDGFSRLSLESNAYPLFHPFSLSQLNALVRSLSRKNQSEVSPTPDRYQVLFQKGPFIQLLIYSGSGRIVDCNVAASEFYNKPCEQLKGTSFFELHADVSQSLQEMIFSGNGKASNRFVIKLIGPDQQVKDLEFSSEHVVLEDESLIYLSIQDVTLSLQSGELLHQQHEMLRSTLSSIDDLFFTMNRHGEFIEYYQPGSNQQLSLSSDLFVGKSIKEVGFPEIVAQQYLDAIDRVLETGRTEQIEYYLDAFGTRLWYNAKVTPRRNSGNVADGVTVLCRDVTRQKKVEETLIRARDFYLTLLNDFPSMIWKTNASKKADYFNKTWLEFTGRDLKQENTTDWADKIHTDDTPRFLSVLSEAYQQKKPFQLEHRLRHHDGSYRWILDVGRPFYNLDGQFAGFIGSGYDITERRNTEDMLRIQRSALENALEGMLIIDASTDGNQVIYGNKELSKITGISLNQINGMDFLEVIGAPEDSAISRQIQEAISRQKSFKGEYLSANPYGAESWRLLLIAPVHDRRGMVAHFVVVLADITESKISEKILMEKNKELEKTNSELDSFVYSTSHELRSPLMSVLGLINLLEMETKNPEQEKYIGMIKESINKLDQIIHDIIDYSRNSRFEVRSEKVSFRPMIDKAINNLKYMTGAEKILFQLEVNEDHAFYSDVRRVEIIFNNFISNCIKFHNYDQPEPHINIRVNTLPHKTVITIRDNGSGIPSTHMPRIYDMFFRGNQKSNGGGIGLYIVKEIVEKLQGTIDVASVEGEYTQFVVEIPNQNKVILS
ncbi:MAG: PAS domain S-box protein, partial [Bacteroidales bacterium]